MHYKLLIDADSILYKVGYRNADTLHVEHMYADVIREISKIEQAMWLRVNYVKGDTIETEVLLTKGSNFRYDIFPAYKSNRKEKTALDDTVSELRKLTLSRLDYATYTENTEADDIIIDKSNRPQLADTTMFIAAIDKDITGVCLVPCYNYNKNVWVEAHSPLEAEVAILTQTIVGDNSDGYNFCKGLGPVKAKEVIDDLLAERITKQDYIDKFGSEANCIVANRLVRMDQYDTATNTLTLWTLDDWSLDRLKPAVIDTSNDW